MAPVRFRYAAAVVLLVAAYYAVPPARPVFVGLLGLLAVGAIVLGVRRHDPPQPGAWGYLAVALALLAAGDTIFNVLATGADDTLPFPSAPDFLYIAAYIPMTVALLALGRTVRPYRDEMTLIDAVSATLAGSLVAWIFVVRPSGVAAELDLAGRLTAVGGWVGYIGVFAASIRVLIAWRRNLSVMLLALAVVTFLVTEVLYGSALVEGTLAAGGPVDVGYFAFMALAGAAALEPSMRDIAAPARPRHALGPGRLTLIAVSMLVAPTVLLVEASLGNVQTGFAIAVVSALVSLLMLARLAITARAYQRRAAREHAARIASRALVSAASAQDMVAATRAALGRVVRGGAGVAVELVRPFTPGSEPVGPVTRPGRGDRQVEPLAGSDAALAITAPPYELSELSDLVATLADQAALALQRIDLIRAAHEEERERYFRTLVLTSSDVTLISRDGRIEYATPSAKAMFGRDIAGERLGDVLTPAVEPVHEQGGVMVRDAVLLDWSDTLLDGYEATLRRLDGTEVTVLVHRRDLTDDPTVRGVVTTLRDITEERALKRDLAYRASHDDLTGLANARAWGEALRTENERRRDPGEGIGVIVIDLDNFKQINDRFGHPVGDELLAEVARRIRVELRAQDVAARVGGDEFAVLLRGLSGVEDARAVAQRLAEALARPVEIDSDVLECQASIGLAYTEGREQIKALMRQADTALYAAKEQGKGRWTEYNPDQRRPDRKTASDTATRRVP